MNRNVSAERRRRRAVDGPQGEEPAEFEPQRVVRVMRCPKCRTTIATMRRWRMSCNECGHEWEEETVLTAADKLADAKAKATEYVVMALMWLGLLACICLTVGLFIFLGLWLVGGLRGLILGMFVLLLLGGLGGMAGARNERVAQYTFWSRGWRDRF
jgi:hypothetical protein